MKKRNRILRLIAVIVTLVSMMSFAVIPAAAAEGGKPAYSYPGDCYPEYGYYHILHVDDSKYLGANSAGRFRVQEQGDIFLIEKIQMSDQEGVYAYKITVEESSAEKPGVCIKVNSFGGYPRDKTEIVSTYGTNLWHERWVFENAGDGNVYIRSYLDDLDNTTELPETDGGAIGVHPCMDINPDTQLVCTWHKDTSRTSQLWKLEKVTRADLLAGEGTEEKPFEISSCEQLAHIAECVSKRGLDYSGKYFKLTSSFTYTGSPIGDEKHPFCGIFDGNCNTVNVQINGDSQVGLFSRLQGATVKNLQVSGSVKGAGAVGAIAGYADSNTVINNCHVAANVVGTGENVGGIVGMMDTSMVSNCRMDGSVASSGKNSFGGIVGGIESDGKIINCVNTGKVTGAKAVGGILGCVLSGKPVIVNCASLGSTAESESGNGIEHGGIVGLIGAEVKSMDIKGCFTNCVLGGSANIGYIIGNKEKADPINCEKVYYIPSGNASGIAGAGGDMNLQVESNITMTSSEKLVVTMGTLTNYAKGRTEAGVAWTAWEQYGNGISPISFQQPGNVPTGFTLSVGNLWIIAIGAVVIVGGIAAIVISKKKKA